MLYCYPYLHLTKTAKIRQDLQKNNCRSRTTQFLFNWEPGFRSCLVKKLSLCLQELWQFILTLTPNSLFSNIPHIGLIQLFWTTMTCENKQKLACLTANAEKFSLHLWYLILIATTQSPPSQTPSQLDHSTQYG